MTEKRVTELWSELKAWYGAHLPEVAESLSAGASEQAVAAVEAELQGELGRGLPAELRELYLQNDGQDGSTLCGVFFGLEFSSLEQMLTDWRGWRDLAKDDMGLNDDFRELGTIYPPETIQNVYAHPGWLPFCRDGGGNHLGLDLQPGPDGRVGQIINIGRDEHNRRVLAPSLGAFLEWLLGQYRAGNYDVVTGSFDGQEERYLRVRFPERESFLDAVPILFSPDKGQSVQVTQSGYFYTALEAAAKAIQIVRDGAEGALDVRSKGRPNDVVTQVDVASEKAIRKTILAAFPDHSILGEEEGLVGNSPYRWIIDPLDGTANFARGLPHYCVSVGLERAGEGLVGVVANPLTGDVYRAERGAGCLKNDVPALVSGCRAVAEAYISMSFGPDESAFWDALLRRAHTLRRLGATALELAWVAEGKLDAYVGFGQGAWDLAAGRVLVAGAGGAVKMFDDGKSCIAAASEELLEELENALALAQKLG